MGQACSCSQPVVLEDDVNRTANELNGKVRHALETCVLLLVVSSAATYLDFPSFAAFRIAVFNRPIAERLCCYCTSSGGFARHLWCPCVETVKRPEVGNGENKV